MQQSLRNLDLDALQATITNLQRSSQRTLPMFAIGILATIIAGGLALWYVFSLLGELDNTRSKLRQTQQALIEARLALGKANAVLHQSQATASAANAPRIAAAIDDVSKSEAKLTSAARSLTQATVALPSSRVGDSDNTLTGIWTDSFGTSYEIRQNGNDFSYEARFKGMQSLGSAAHGRASGKADGNKLQYNYRDMRQGVFVCQGNVSADSQRIEESCRAPNGELLHVTLVRL